MSKFLFHYLEDLKSSPKYANKSAFMDLHEGITFYQFYNLSKKIANELRRLNLSFQVIAVTINNSITSALLYMAADLANVTLLTIREDQGLEELKYILDEVKPKTYLGYKRLSHYNEEMVYKEVVDFSHYRTLCDQLKKN